MSWKGFQKGVARTPQALRHKIHPGQGTKDPVFTDTERRFEAIESQTQRLHAESKRYGEAIGKMLDHQVEFSQAIEQIYQPIKGNALDASDLEDDGKPDGIAACQQYTELVTELKELVKPELEMIETRILKPADELLTITKSIKKALTKREHKLIDLDRFGQSLQKIQAKPERSAKEEEKMYKAENDYEMALEEYNYYNELLKDELPKLFALEAQFIKPLFQSFYYMQLNINYTLFMHMEQMKIPYFDMTGDIRDQYYRKRGDIKERAESIGLTHFRTGYSKAKLEATRRKFGRAGPGEAPSPGGSLGRADSRSSRTSAGSDSAPPYDYDDEAPARPSRPDRGEGPGAGYPREKQEYVRPRQSDPGVEHCRALYDFEAQAAGDLGFRAGDIIEIVKRSADSNDWWTGRLNGAEGSFPGNYVRLDV